MKTLVIIYSIIFLFIGCSTKNDTPTNIDKKEVKSDSTNIQFRETFVCFTNGLKITIENTSKDKLTEEEAHSAFLKGCKVRHLDPNRCYKYYPDGSVKEYKNFKQINPMLEAEMKVKKGHTLGKAIEN